MKTVVVIDAGGRGAALVAAYGKSPHVAKIIAIPGNELMQMNSKKLVVIYQHIKTIDVKEIVEVSKKVHADLIDVAQDNAVAVGVADALQKEGFSVVGPTKSAGELEWNKAFARDFMHRRNIPQPEYFIFDDYGKGIAFLTRQKSQSWFVKAAGLCEGKGVLPAANNAEAEERIIELKKFGEAGKIFLLEKWLKSDGSIAEEFSAFAISDGNTFQIVGYAQDHKRALDGDNGENTGGMGCSTPPLAVDNDIRRQTEEIFRKTFDGMKKEGRPYKGILYLGGIIIRGNVYVIEFNARWGDPEAEVIVPGIVNDFYHLNMAAARGTLGAVQIKTDGKSRVSVAVCAKGYPGDYKAAKGKEITGIDKAIKIPGVTVYGAGIIRERGKFVVNGGRVIHVVGEGRNIAQARQAAYSAIKNIAIEGNNLHYRSDIGWRDLKRMNK